MTDILSTIAAQNGIHIDADTSTENNTPTQHQDTQSDDSGITFTDLNLAKPILAALTRSGYERPTPIQAQAIPFALAGRDLLLSAQTGSGKTASFVLPLLDKLSRSTTFDKNIKALILAPTRELAQQVHDNVRNYSKEMRGLFAVPLVGGAPYNGQINALRKGVQVVVATPGRLLDHINAGRVDLSHLEVLVLDEADRMLDMGFADDINDILKAAPADRQTIMCSATWDGPVGNIAASFTKNPERVSIKVESAHIDETAYYCDDFDHKNKILDKVICQQDVDQIIIFAATKRSTEKLAQSLIDDGHKANFLHGDLPQGKRNRILQDVRKGKCKILVATDVAARGLDVPALSHVINYDLPRQTEDYVHRIGRCGRAGRSGVAVNLCSMDDRPQLAAINRYLKRHMPIAEIEGLEPTKTYTPKENKGRGRGRGRGRSNASGAGRGRSAGGYRGEGRGEGEYQGGNRRSENKSHDGKPFENKRSGKRFGEDKPRTGKPAGKPYKGKSSRPSRDDARPSSSRPNNRFGGNKSGAGRGRGGNAGGRGKNGA